MHNINTKGQNVATIILLCESALKGGIYVMLSVMDDALERMNHFFLIKKLFRRSNDLDKVRNDKL